MSDKKKVTYKVIKEDKENYLLSTILKENVEVEFNLGDVEKHKDRLVTAADELDAKARVHAAEMINLEKHNPYLKEFDAKKLHAIGMYIDALRELKQIEPTLEQYKKALADYEVEQMDIYTQCKFDITKLVEKDEFEDVPVSEEESPNDKPDEGEEKPVKK